MNERKQRIEELFQAALELDAPDQRAVFLERMCAGEPALRAEVEELLRAAEAAEAVFQPYERARATERAQPAEPIQERPGSIIGRYKLLQLIGEGGMGAVFMAEQQEPVRRRVAFKIIKLGMDTRQVVARFEAERQALALMDHPHIAKVLDGGGTDTGRPYFVMELVQGVPLTRFCDQNQFSTEERLRLFIPVCHAIQHAHQKGIIHRDLKPTNVLVTLNDPAVAGHPMVIDFGVAKATNQKLTEKTLFTNFATMIGTPAYMSPEQAEMSKLDVDTRTDIYSLGVLLYELLTGTTPFPEERLRSASYLEMQRIICEEKPERPSTKLTKAALAADARSHSLQSQIKNQKSKIQNDLDWIVMKCLEKDRTRRYETANGLAEDLRRHLNNEPILARPPSRLYEFRKSVQRHKVGFAATAAIILVLAAGVLVSTWQREKSQAEELAARRRAYASDMNLAEQALDEGNLGVALDLLNRQRPGAGQKDLRGWEWRYLWGQTRSDARSSLCQIKGEVNSVAASPDGRWLAVGAFHQGGVTVWHLPTRQQLTCLATNEERVRAAFSPTQPLLAFAGTQAPASQHTQSTLHLWNMVTRQMLTNLPLDNVCAGLAFSKDGRTLVTCTPPLPGGHITLWRMPDGTQLTNYPSTAVFLWWANPFAATPDLSLAAYGLMGARVRVVELRTGKELWMQRAGKGPYMTALAFSPDGKTLASAWGESNIELWDAATGKELKLLEGHTDEVDALVFWPDGKKLASGSGDQTIRIWDVGSGKCLDVLRGHTNEVWRMALLPDHKTLVSGSKDGAVCLWDTSITHPRRRSVTITMPTNSWGWCFSPDSQFVLTWGRGGVTRCGGPNFQQEKRLISLPAAARANTVLSPHGRFLAAGLTNGVVQVWDVTGGVLWRQLTNSTGPMFPVKFFSDGDKLLTGARGPSFQEWDLTTGLKTRSGSLSREEVRGVQPSQICVSPDGRLSVGGNMDECGVVDLAGVGHPSRPLDIQEARGGISFSPDGRLLAVGSYLGYVCVWDTANWRKEATLGGFPHSVDSVAFSPDGKRLAAGGGTSRLVRIWDTESWQNVFTLQGQGAHLTSTAFSPDGNTIASRNINRQLQLWRAPSWAEILATEKAEDATAPAQQPQAP